MKIGLFVNHGFAARNFLQSGLLAKAADSSEVVVFHSLGPGLTEEVEHDPDRVTWVDSPAFSEGARGYLLRRTLLLAHLRVCDTEGMRWMLSEYAPRGQLSRAALAARLAWHQSRSVRDHDALQKGDERYARIQAGRTPTREWEQLLREHRPTVLLSTDQRPPDNVALTLAAKRLGIPAGAFVFSWDNLSSKGRMPGPFDFYLVWSEHMKQELMRFYPAINSDQVTVTGPPQFGAYLDPALSSARHDFIGSLGLDPEQPLVCFSGEDPITDPENVEHLLALLEATDASSPAPQVVVRPSPVDDPDRWRRACEGRSNVTVSPPPWRRPDGNWTRALPTHEDNRLLANLLTHCAAGVNMVSTMTLDFALAGKPTINLAFDVADPPLHGVPVWEKHFRFEHYQTVVDNDAALFARSQAELPQLLRQVLDRPDVNRPGREALIQLHTEGLTDAACGLVVSALSDRAEETR